MSARPKKLRRKPAASPIEQHRDWLQLVDSDGPFLSVPVVKAEWPNGMDRLESGSPRHIAFVDAFNDWRAKPEAQHEAWIKAVLEQSAEWGDYLVAGTELPERLVVDVPERHTTIRPWGALFSAHADKSADLPAVLVFTAAPGSPLRAPSDALWSASEIDRAAYALRATGVPMAVVTDGRWWAVVSASANSSTASGVVDATLWREEDLLRDAFLSLINVRRLIAGPVEQRLSALFERSLLQQEEVTEALGTQVRRAVELLVQAMSEAKIEAARQGRPDPLTGPPAAAYEIAVTIMMRVVFLLFAEERGMLPIDRDLYRTSYAISPLLDELDVRARDGEEDLANSTLAWYRLLATSAAVYSGATFEDLRMPAYGGSLFDPERFPQLTARNDDGSLKLPINDRVMWHVLKAVQTERSTGQLRRISFREIDVEQIGYIYEGLLGYTTHIADETILGLKGKDGDEPEIALAKLQSLIDDTTDDQFAATLTAFLKDDQPAAKPPTAAQLRKARTAPVDEAEARRLLLPVCHHDPELIEQILPLFGLLRADLRGLPLVVPPGGLLVVETPSRKNAGAHYTPRSLAEEVVKYTLEPLVYSPGPLLTGDESKWKPVSSAEILDLKVADIAAGSGAFLVAASRFLGEKLVGAWAREGSIDLDELDDVAAVRLRTRAEREVIAHCLYGADINPMAVEMCKLSLWLVSMDPTKPFSFVDDKVLCGNSLLGLTSADQLRYLHIAPDNKKAKQLVLARDIDGPLRRATQLRESISQSTVDDDDPQRSANRKAALLREARETTAMLRDIADGVVAAGLQLSGKPGKALEEAYENLSIAVLNAYPDCDDAADDSMLANIQAAGLTPTVETDFARWEPLHWILEVPDVMARGGFDAIIGNPPFLVAKNISASVGVNLRGYLANQVGYRRSGKADMVSYFLLRAAALVSSSGMVGLILAKSVAEGDTRDVGLSALLADSFKIVRCYRSRKWPSSIVSTRVSTIWGTFCELGPGIQFVCDGIPVSAISPSLVDDLDRGLTPIRLDESVGLAIIGSALQGAGFVIEPSVAEGLLKVPINRDVVKLYLNGRELNNSPTQSASKWVIDFGERSEAAAQGYPGPWEIVERAVKPERLLKDRDRYPRMVNEWWKFWRTREDLYAAIAGFPRVLTMTVTSSTGMPIFVDAGQVYSSALVVFVTDDVADLAIYSSEFHQLWARKHSSRMQLDLRYSVSDALETFPVPRRSERLRISGKALEGARASAMAKRNIGLTPLYSLVNAEGIRDADIELIRDAHVEIDAAVAQAYGMAHIELDHGFHQLDEVTRFTVSPVARSEILNYLLHENHRRAAIEAEQNVGSVSKSGGARKAKKPQQTGEDLFGDELN